MNRVKRPNRIRQKVLTAKEELLNAIANDFSIGVPIELAPREEIFLGAQGCFEGDSIKVNRDLPLFWQLIILEHEMGHYLAEKGGGRSGIIYHRFTPHPLSTGEKRAWEWVGDNPIIPGGIIDRNVRKYIDSLQRIGRTFGHLDMVMRVGWWY